MINRPQASYLPSSPPPLFPMLTVIECIAEYTGRPLLSLTCADIGTDEIEMEDNLSGWFQLAEKWGAVMLIDEADVYLESRRITDLKRNSLVSGKTFAIPDYTCTVLYGTVGKKKGICS